MNYRAKKGRNIWLLICTAPALIFFLSIKLIPSGLGLWYSLTNWNGINPSYRRIGLENFIEIFTRDTYFWNSMGFTLKYVIWIVITMNLAALALAVAIEGLGRGKGAFRTIFYLPNMISMIIGGYMWNFIFTRVLYFFADNWGWTFLDHSWIGIPLTHFTRF